MCDLILHDCSNSLGRAELPDVEPLVDHVTHISFLLRKVLRVVHKHLELCPIQTCNHCGQPLALKVLR